MCYALIKKKKGKVRHVKNVYLRKKWSEFNGADKKELQEVAQNERCLQAEGSRDTLYWKETIHPGLVTARLLSSKAAGSHHCATECRCAARTFNTHST